MRCDEFEVSQRRAESSSGTFAHTRLLKNGAAAHEFTRDDRAKGGRVRAEKIKKRKELQERFDVATLEAECERRVWHAPILWLTEGIPFVSRAAPGRESRKRGQHRFRRIKPVNLLDRKDGESPAERPKVAC